MLPISMDAANGPEVVKNLVVVYAWTGEPELSFEALVPLTKMPFGSSIGCMGILELRNFRLLTWMRRSSDRAQNSESVKLLTLKSFVECEVRYAVRQNDD
jgi:hypothetical protein